MLKKVLVGAAVVLVGSVVMFGRDTYSYLNTSATKLHSQIRDNVPIEFEIERARTLVAQLVPDIQQNMHVIAQEEVEIEDLEKQMATMERNIQDEQERIRSLRADIGNTSGRFRYAGRAAKTEEVRTELNRRFERFKTASATLEAKKRLLEARQKSLTAAKQKLEDMIAAKRDLEVQVQNLEARLKTVQAAETNSQFQFDDSNLARCKTLVRELRKRLDVAERIVERDGRVLENFEFDFETPRDLEQQIDKYFESKPGPMPMEVAGPKAGA
jgi:chromosome segregation ATPase